MERSDLRRAASTCVVLASLVASRAAAEDSDAVRTFRAAREEVVAKLEAFADWCGQNNCPGDRDRAYETVLEIEPNDAVARKALHFERGKDGKWKRVGAPPSSRTDPVRQAEMSDRRDAAVRALRDAALTLVFEPDAPFEIRERAVEDLVAVDPNNVEGRRANHETQVEGRWWLDETLAARRRRGALTKLATDSRAAAKAPAQFNPSAEEKAFSPGCGASLGNQFVRVVAGPGTNEADAVARIVESMRPVYAELFGVDAPTWSGYRIWLFAGMAEGAAALDRETGLTAADRAWLKQLAAAWRPKKNEVLVWTPEPDDRIDGSMRQTLGASLNASFSLDVKQGWAWEGVGQWFSEVLLGRHRTFFVRPAQYASPTDAAAAMELRQRLMSTGADWLGEARDLEKSGKWPDLRLMLAHDVNALTIEELVASYALARFFVEGRAPREIADVLRSVGKSENPDRWIGSRLGMTLDHLDRRLRRWVRETK